jgi:NADPH-dependent 2,4-dienoyl-CoA reductase/sulfur reductase-like enzyme
MKVIIVGGVAGGASCAARLRRLDEKAQIIMVERGPYVSYANCGLPYHIGGVIEQESSLLVASEKTVREQFAVDCRTNCEAVSISPKKRTVVLRNVVSGEFPRDREILAIRRSAQRAYSVARMQEKTSG